MTGTTSKLRKGDCQHCGGPFSTYYLLQRFCSRPCARLGGAKRVPKLNPELLKHADILAPKGGKLRYIAQEAGCTQQTVNNYAKKIGFEFSPRNRKKATAVGSSEQDYAKRTGCVICPERRVTEAAHIVPRRNGGSGRIQNIIPLCPTHHRCFDRDLLTSAELQKTLEFIKLKAEASESAA